MEMGGFGYENRSLVRLSEEIYRYKNEKKDLELELCNARFHYDYIAKRKGLVQHEVIFRLFFIVGISFFLVSILCLDSGINMFILLLPFLLYADYKLIKREVKMLFLLSYNWNPNRMNTLASRLDIDTFQNDKIHTEKKIASLQERMDLCDAKIEELLQKKKEMILQKQQQEDVLRKRGILFDEHPNKGGKISLKEEDGWANSIQELDECYRREEAYLQSLLSNIEAKIQFDNKEITNIDHEFEECKKLFVFCALVFLLVVLLQTATTGIVYTFTSIVCIIASMIGILYLEHRCKQPVLRYLVEHEHPLVADYAFTNGMTPVSEHRKELIDNKEEYEKELEEVKQKRKALTT